MNKFLIIGLFCATGCMTAHTHPQYVSKQTLASVSISYQAVIDRLESRVEELEKELASTEQVKARPVDSQARILYLTMWPDKELPKYNVTTVQRGDTFSVISYRTGVSFKELMRLNPKFNLARIDDVIDKRRWDNNWDPDYIKPGDEIVIP